MTLFYLVRHGRTTDSGVRITGYRPGVHLDEMGIAQAQSAAAALSRQSIQALYASPLERTRETAAYLASALNLTVQIADFLKEVDFGDLQGLGPELAESPVWQQFSSHPAHVVFPGGESVKAAQQRIVDGLDKLSVLHGEEPIACFAHCEILRLALAHALKMPLDEFMRLTVDPGSISCVLWEKDHQKVLNLNIHP